MSNRNENKLPGVFRQACYAVVLLLIASCNCIKYLKPGQQLYTGAEIKVESKDNVNSKEIRKELENIAKPKPNQTIFGIRFKLWFYFVAGEDPQKGFKKWLKYKLGEKPVFYDPQIPNQVSDLMVNRLNNLGFFNAATTYTVSSKKSKTKILYTAAVTRPYHINRVAVPQGSTLLGMKIKELEEGTLLKPGMQYKLDLVRAERERIDQALKNDGFYYFNPDYILFKADSAKGNKTIDLLLTIKPEIPAKARAVYTINDIYIYSSHRLRDSARRRKVDTLEFDNYHYVTADSTFRPRAITGAVFLHKGDKYSRKNHSLTLNRLMGMGVFHYANVKFNDTLVNGQGKLNTFIYLTPMQKRSLQLEIQAVTKSNNYTGPALTLSYRNRNLFRSAELFVFNLNTNYETQFTGIQKGFNSYEIGASTQLFLPKFVTPFRVNNVSSVFVPRTKFDLGVRNLNRVLYFSMNSVSFSYGYTWRESKEKDHELNPVSISFARVMNTTSAFEELLIANPFLRKSFEQQFTLGSFYAFTYNSLTNGASRDQYYYNGLIDVSGNTASLIYQLATGRKADPEDPFQLFGFPYSQYAKISNDVRYHHTINKNSKIATRLIAGAGLPYGNSNAMPYIKQFFSGGSNSIRAFLPRTVGPGVYVTPDSLLRRRFLDQAGDLKLEGNIEYRFTVISLLKGALFLDAGNVWLLRKSDQVPGGEFKMDQFYKQLAVGTGFGLRLDVTYFVLRFDLGMALRKPYLPFGERWVIRHIDLGDNNWRRNNLVLNIAIGYPF